MFLGLLRTLTMHSRKGLDLHAKAEAIRCLAAKLCLVNKERIGFSFGKLLSELARNGCIHHGWKSWNQSFASDREPLVAPMPRIMPSRPEEKRPTEEGESKNEFIVSRQSTEITLKQKKK